MRNYHVYVLLSDNTWYHYVTAGYSLSVVQQGARFKAREENGTSFVEAIVKEVR